MLHCPSISSIIVKNGDRLVTGIDDFRAAFLMELCV